jgi:hypothetical protein
MIEQIVPTVPEDIVNQTYTMMKNHPRYMEYLMSKLERENHPLFTYALMVRRRGRTREEIEGGLFIYDCIDKIVSIEPVSQCAKNTVKQELVDDSNPDYLKDLLLRFSGENEKC